VKKSDVPGIWEERGICLVRKKNQEEPEEYSLHTFAAKRARPEKATQGEQE
jgi:hypothetical protein